MDSARSIQHEISSLKGIRRGGLGWGHRRCRAVLACFLAPGGAPSASHGEAGSASTQTLPPSLPACPPPLDSKQGKKDGAGALGPARLACLVGAQPRRRGDSGLGVAPPPPHPGGDGRTDGTVPPVSVSIQGRSACLCLAPPPRRRQRCRLGPPGWEGAGALQRPAGAEGGFFRLCQQHCPGTERAIRGWGVGWQQVKGSEDWGEGKRPAAWCASPPKHCQLGEGSPGKTLLWTLSL